MALVKNIFLYAFVVIDSINIVISCPDRCTCRYTKVFCSHIPVREIKEISMNIPLLTKKLYLLGNEWEEFPIEEFQQLKKLEFLNLDTNRLKSLPSNLSTFLPDMKQLHVPMNEIENLTMLEGYENVELLKLDRNIVKNVAPYTFKGLPNLRELSLQQNRIERISEFTFYGLKRLRKLDLRSNNIKEIDERAFYQTPNLEQIHLDMNKLTKLPDRLFSENSRLRTVYLSNNEIEYIGKEAFGNLTLDAIYLNTNKIKRLPDDTFNHIQVNHKVYMNNNLFRCDCNLIMKLKTSFRELNANKKLSLGSCYRDDARRSSSEDITNLRADEFQNCSICDIKTCEKDRICFATNRSSFEYVCEKQKLPLNISPTREERSDRRKLWITISVCIPLAGIIVILIFWVYFQRKKRSKLIINQSEFKYEKVTTKRTSMFLAMVTLTKKTDTLLT